MKKYIFKLAVVAGLLLSLATSGYSHTSHGGALSHLESSIVLPFGGSTATSADSTLFKEFLTLNKAYRSNDSVVFKGLKALFKATATNQSPKAFVLDCIDSRVIPELCFEQTIGKIFTGRTAGNMISGDITGSLSYAVNFKHVTCVVVLGHTNCGAVSAAVDYYNNKLDTVTAGVQLTALVARISNNAVKSTIAADKNGKLKPYESSNAKFVDAVAQTNVTWTAGEVKKTFSKLKLNIFQAIYNTANGEVTQIL